MKKHKRLLSFLLSLVLTVGLLFNQMNITDLIAASEVEPMELKLMGSQWSCTKNGSTTLPAYEFVQVVDGEGEAKTGKNSLRIGHETEATDIELTLELSNAIQGECYKFDVFAMTKDFAGTDTAKLTLKDKNDSGSNHKDYVLSSTSGEWTHIKNTDGTGCATDIWLGDSNSMQFIVSAQLDAGTYVYLDDLYIVEDMSWNETLLTNEVPLNADVSFERWSCIWNQYSTSIHDSEFVKIVEDESNTGSKSLRVGHETSPTNLTLEMILPVNVPEGGDAYQFDAYIKTEGTMNADSAIYLWNSSSNSRCRKIEGEYTDWTHIENDTSLPNEAGQTDWWIYPGYMKLQIAVICDAGEYLYIDDLMTFKCTDKEKVEKGNLVFNPSFETLAEIIEMPGGGEGAGEGSATIDPPTKVADYPADWERWANNDDYSEMFLTDSSYEGEMAFAFVDTKENASSLTQTVTGLLDGTYVFSAWVKSSGGQKDTTVVLKGFDESNPKSQIGVAIPERNEWTQITREFDVTNGEVYISIWNDANADNWLVVDDMKLTSKADSSTNLLKNGNFEVKGTTEGDSGDGSGDSTVTGEPPKKIADYPTGWERWGVDDDLSQMFITNDAYKGEAAFAFLNTKEHASSLTQTITGLADGTYVLSAWIKSSGGQKDAVIIVKGFDESNTSSQMGLPISKNGAWTQITREVEVTSGQVILSIWNDANEGNWMIVDNVTLSPKSDAEEVLNYVQNGDFEVYKNIPPFQLPPKVSIDENGVINIGTPSSGSEAEGNGSQSSGASGGVLTGDNSLVLLYCSLFLNAMLGIWVIAGKRTKEYGKEI